VIALANAGGWSAVRVCLVDNTLGRSLHAAPEFGHANGPLYYLGVFPVESLPWVIALPAAIASGVLARNRRGGRTTYLACIVVAGLAMLSLPSTKRGLYALPLYPAAAVVAGVWLTRAGSKRERRIDRITLASLLALIVIVLLVAGGCAAWIEYGGGAPEKLASSVAFLREHYGISGAARSGSRGSIALITAVVAGGTGLATAWFALHAARHSVASLARACACSALAMFLVWSCVVQPFIDPLKNMSDGARRSMDEVPASEPLLGLALDETTRAIIPYYTGRFIHNVARPEEALDALRNGPSKHLVVMESAEHEIDAGLRVHLSTPVRKRLDAGRALNVYGYVP